MNIVRQGTIREAERFIGRRMHEHGKTGGAAITRAAPGRLQNTLEREGRLRRLQEKRRWFVIQVEWVLPEREVSRCIDEIQVSGGKIESAPRRYKPSAEELDDYGDSYLDPLSVIVVSVAGAYLISALSNVWRDVKYTDGYVIDARNSNLRIRHLPGQSGTLVFIDDSGVRRIPRERHTEGEEILKSLAAKMDFPDA